MATLARPEKRKPRTPKFRLHKATGQGFVEIDGHRHYLGRYDCPESEQRYHIMIREWLAHGYRLPISPDDVTCNELAEAFLTHCMEYYRRPDGSPTSSLSNLKLSVFDMLEIYGSQPAKNFGPVALRAVRHVWIERNLSIATINSYVGNLRRMFQWGVSHQMVAPETLQALQAVQGLRKGRGVGKDPKKRSTVEQAAIDAVLPHLTKPLRAIVELLLLTGARPSEILQLRRRDIDATGPVWVAVLRDHKMSYREQDRRLFFGPRAQTVLKPFLLRPDADFLFSPKESVKERASWAEGHRRPNQKPNPTKTDRTLNDHYDHVGLRKAIERACKTAGVPKWTPYQLRHTAATRIEATADWEVARAILGHSSVDTTQIYVHRDSKAAIAFAHVHG